ncbi:MAG: ubiquinol-cytochrome c reductase iron-sulfur subunit [Acidimicrobiia bacterium]
MTASGEPPVWRRDFPYSSEGEDLVTRREFARFLVAASVAVAGSSAMVSLWASLRSVNRGAEREIAALDMVPVGGSLLFEYPSPDDPAILIRPETDVVLGFSQKCTHLGCVVYWAPESGHLECPCHEGVFDLGGEPVSGPPDRPLGRIDVEIRDGTVWALGVEAAGA